MFNLLCHASGMGPLASSAMKPFPPFSALMKPDQPLRLRHHKGAFVGCFSMYRKSNINWMLFEEWKANPTRLDHIRKITGIIANKFLSLINNHYSFITTPPPSTTRNLANYCTYNLAETISRRSGIPFYPIFQQRLAKTTHGRFASLAQEPPQPTWYPSRKSILLIDDCITSGTTMKQCYQVLSQKHNHVDGLVFVCT